jgi:hypothetical protein
MTRLFRRLEMIESLIISRNLSGQPTNKLIDRYDATVKQIKKVKKERESE